MNLSHLASEKLKTSEKLRRPRYNPYNFYKNNTPSRAIPASRGGTNSDRCQRQKQGAVSGAALRFLQAPAVARRKKRLSARGPAMVTYSDLIQTGILIVAIIDVVLRLIEAERNRKQ